MPSNPTKRTDISDPLNNDKDKALKASTFIKLPSERSSLPFHKKYTKGIKLGSGAYGEVYSCIDNATKNDRAVKIIPIKKLRGGGKNPKEDERILQEFVNEVNLLRSLDHPNIMKIYDCGITDDQCYLVTDVFVGGELFNEIIRREKFDEITAAFVIKQVLSGVRYLHDMNIVHRDLKPENLLLTKNPSKGNRGNMEDEFAIKIIDFGLSTFVKNPDQTLRDRVGSAYYIAPEILRRNYGPACDIWSTGVILFVLLAGYPPFSGDDDQEIIANVQTGKYSLDPAYWRGISEEAKDLVRKMMEVDVKKRLTASQALQHPWFTKCLTKDPSGTKNHKPLMVALRNMRAYSGNQDLTKAATLLLGSKLTTQAETEELTKVFRTLDLNQDGRLDREELIQGYRTLIQARGFCAKLFSPSDICNEVDDILAKVDFDKNGFIDYSEFISVAMDRHTLFSKERLTAAFKTFDGDDSGSIELSEVQQYLNTSDAEWSSICAKYDIDGNGKIDVDEFIAMMESQVPPPKKSRDRRK